MIDPLRTIFSPRIWMVALGLCSCSGLGCVDGPAAQLNSLNPWRRQEWEEDEKYGATPFLRVGELESLSENVSRMNAAEKSQVTERLDLRLASEKDPRIRAKTIKVMAVLDTPNSRSAVLAGLKDPDPQVRIASCEGLGKKGDESSLKALAEVVGSDTDLDVRIASVKALQNYKDPIAIRALGIALDDDDPALQYRAVQSLKAASGRDFGDSIPAWKQFVRGETPQVKQPSVADRLRNLF